MIKKVYSKRHHPGWKYEAHSKRYSSWAFDIRLANGQRKRESGFLNRAEAESVIAQIRLHEKDGDYPLPKEVPTLREFVKTHVAGIVSRREQVRASRVLNGLCALLPVGLKINEVLTTHIQLWVEYRQRDGLVPSSINRELNIVSAMLHAARVHTPALSDWNPPRMPRPKQPKRRRERVISAAEVSRVLTWLYAPQRPDETEARMLLRRNVGHVFRTALLTGARKGELCKLKWDQIDWGAMVVQIVGTKTEMRSEQTVRYLKITETLAEIFRERLAHSRGGYVFTSGGREVTHYYRILAEACEAAGVSYGRATGFVTHDARHTAITRMLQSGCDLATIGSITGHKDKTLILHYGHASTESRARAIAVLEKFAGKESLGLGLDAVPQDVLILSGIGKGLVPEVGLEPT